MLNVNSQSFYAGHPIEEAPKGAVLFALEEGGAEPVGPLRPHGASFCVVVDFRCVQKQRRSTRRLLAQAQVF